MPSPSTTTTPQAGGSSSAGEGEGPMSATSSVGSSFRFVPAFCLGVAAAVVFQLAWGGLTLTSFFLKLFIYVSFALLCFLAGSFVLLVRKSPLKVSCFARNTRQSAAWLEFFNKLMVRHCYLLVQSHYWLKLIHKLRRMSEQLGLDFLRSLPFTHTAAGDSCSGLVIDSWDISNCFSFVTFPLPCLNNPLQDLLLFSHVCTLGLYLESGLFAGGLAGERLWRMSGAFHLDICVLTYIQSMSESCSTVHIWSVYQLPGISHGENNHVIRKLADLKQCWTHSTHSSFINIYFYL